MVGNREFVSRLSYGIKAVEIFRASDVSASWKTLATRKPEIPSAKFTIVLAPTLVLPAHSLQEPSVVCSVTRGVKILLVLSEEPQTLGYCVDSDPIGERDGLRGDQYSS